MKTQLLILACSSFILFGCNRNTASQNAKDSTETTQVASETKAIDPDRQQLMDELAEYKDNPDIPPVQEKLARAYYDMLKTGGGDLEEIRGFISELQDSEQAAVEQVAQEETPSASENFEIRIRTITGSDATQHFGPTVIHKLEIIPSMMPVQQLLALKSTVATALREVLIITRTWVMALWLGYLSVVIHRIFVKSP